VIGKLEIIYETRKDLTKYIVNICLILYFLSSYSVACSSDSIISTSGHSVVLR